MHSAAGLLRVACWPEGVYDIVFEPQGDSTFHLEGPAACSVSWERVPLEERADRAFPAGLTP